jgi:hypothetical protein
VVESIQRELEEQKQLLEPILIRDTSELREMTFGCVRDKVFYDSLDSIENIA